MIQSVTYNVLVEKDEDGVFVASVLELPGCVSDGDTLEDAIDHVLEAAQGYVELLHEAGLPTPEGALSAEPVMRRLEILLVE